MSRLFTYLQRLVLCAPFTFALLIAAAESPRWLEVRSPHFSVITDAGARQGHEVAVRFEQMRAIFGAMFNHEKVNLPIPLQIVAFRSAREMRQFAPLWRGKPTPLSGLFVPGQDHTFIVLDLSQAEPWRVVFHEYAHQLLNGNMAHKAPWFDEGFAEYFSTIQVDNKQVFVGKLPQSVLTVIRQDGMMKIADLFKVRHDSAIYNENGDHRTAFYAESNLVVHYIYDHQLMAKVNVYFDLETNENLPVEDAIQQAFGMSAAQFDKALQNYVAGGSFKHSTLPTPPGIVTTGYAVAPVSLADANAVLADIHLHSTDYLDKAIREFQDILKVDANNAAAYRGLGYAYLQKKQYEVAGPYFLRAAQLNSKDPRVHYLSAVLLSRDGTFSDREQLSEAIQELETAISLDPAFADSYMLLGFAQYRAGDAAGGLQTMQKAVALDPGDENYQFNLARMYLANKKVDECVVLLHALERTQDEKLAGRVEELLAQIKTAQDKARAALPLHRADAPGESDEQDDSTEDTASTEPAGTEAEAAPSGKVLPVKFIRGTVTAVDCSAPLSASLTLVSPAGKWKMQVADRNHLLVFGLDKFSCSWNNQKVVVQYRQKGHAERDVISIEME
jgi:tetratricopeptide (TPR) repeat protein